MTMDDGESGKDLLLLKIVAVSQVDSDLPKDEAFKYNKVIRFSLVILFMF